MKLRKKGRKKKVDKKVVYRGYCCLPLGDGTCQDWHQYSIPQFRLETGLEPEEEEGGC